MKDIRQYIETALTEIRTAIEVGEITMEEVEKLFLKMLED